MASYGSFAGLLLSLLLAFWKDSRVIATMSIAATVMRTRFIVFDFMTKIKVIQKTCKNFLLLLQPWKMK